MDHLIDKNKTYIFSFTNGQQFPAKLVKTFNSGDERFYLLNATLAPDIQGEFIIREKDIYIVVEDVSDLIKASVENLRPGMDEHPTH